MGEGKPRSWVLPLTLQLTSSGCNISLVLSSGFALGLSLTAHGADVPITIWGCEPSLGLTVPHVSSPAVSMGSQ